MMTQFWVTATALLLCGAIATGLMTPALLLVLTFANGIGLAMLWPVYAAIVPELVPRSQLPAALALNAVFGNASRIIGPLVAGLLIASLGSAYVFVFNAVLAIRRVPSRVLSRRHARCTAHTGSPVSWQPFPPPVQAP